jgi:hypothetical protein
MESIGLDSRIDHRSYQKIGTEIQSQNFRADYISHDKYLISENRRTCKIIVPADTAVAPLKKEAFF